MKTFFLFLDKKSSTARILEGVEVNYNRKGPFLQLPKISEVSEEKFIVFLNRHNPAEVIGGKIYEIYLKTHGAWRFREANFVTAMKPLKETKNIIIFTSVRWSNIELELEIIKGTPNGEFPGTQILKPGDKISFLHKEKKYFIENKNGIVEMTTPETKIAEVQESKSSQIAKFEKRYGKKPQSGNYTLQEILEDTGITLPFVKKRRKAKK